MDRDPESSTYGSADRNYWHYLLHDIPNARLQDVGWLLSLAFQKSKSRYYCKKKLICWAVAAIRYWAKIQYPNGAFDEVYPFEYSYCATAFSTWWAAETFAAIETIDNENREESYISPGLKRVLLKAFEKSGNWLIKNNNLDVANQEAAAATALQLIACITGIDTFSENAFYKVESIISNQHEAGYYPEYGGPDIGYLSLTLSCLATYRNRSDKQTKLENSLSRSMHFLDSKIDSNGLYNWENTSRRTQYLYPFGIASCWDIGGNEILSRYLNGLSRDLVIRPSWMDDRYCTFMAIDYLRTYLLLESMSDPT